jgi:predicted dehydrogenase
VRHYPGEETALAMLGRDGSTPKGARAVTSVRMGVVGVGQMGRQYAEAIQSIAGLELTALCNRSLDRIKDLPGEKFSDHRRLIASGQVDGVVIATPHWSHPEVAIGALNRGLHVLTDKPLAVHVADGRRMLGAHKDGALRFGVIFNERTRPVHVKIKSMIEAGELGEIRRVIWLATGIFRSHAYYTSGGWRATWAGEGGGVLINQASHDLDLLQWFTGLPARVTAKIGLGRYHPIEVEDDVSAILEYPGGATGLFAVTTGEAPGTNRVEIAGDKGKLELDTETGKLRFFRNEVAASEFSRTTKERFIRPPVNEIEVPVAGDGAGPESHVLILENFRDAILTGTALLAPVAEAIRSLEIGNAMLLSGLSGKTVDLPIDAELMERELRRLASG